MKNLYKIVVAVGIIFAANNNYLSAQTINLAQQCDCEVKKPGTEVTAGATTPAGTNTGDLLVDASGDIFYWDGDSWEVSTAGGSTPWDNADGTPASQSSNKINYMSGNVGIGTQNPNQRLQVNNGNIYSTGSSLDTWSNAIVLSRGTGLGTDSRAHVQLSDQNRMYFANTHTTGRRGFQFAQTGSGSSVYFDSLGRVGIGIHNPQNELHVSSPDRTGIIIQPTNTGFQSELALRTGLGSEGWYNQAFGATHPSTSYQNDWRLQYWTGTGGVLSLYAEHTTGYVGIGRTEPLERLHVNGNIAVPYNIKLISGPTTYGNRTILENGWQLGGDGGDVLKLAPAGASNSTIKFYTNGGGTNQPATEKMRITPGGNVGIGDNNPSALLSMGTSLSTNAFTPKLALWGNTFGFGITSGTLNYLSASEHVFNNTQTNTELVRIKGNGQMKMSTYAGGTHDNNNPVKLLGVDGSGNVVAVPMSAVSALVGGSNMKASSYFNTQIAVTGNNTSYYFTVNYTPTYANSTIYIDFDAHYDIAGDDNDGWSGQIQVNGGAVMTKTQIWRKMNNSGASTRSSVAVPISGSYNNTNTNSKQIRVRLWRSWGDDTVAVNGNRFFRIIEVQN